MIRRIGVVGLAAALSQLLQFFAQPLLASHATASEFGALAKLATLAAFLSILASIQLHIAYLSENDEKGRRAIRQIVMLVSVFVALLSAAISAGLGWQVSASTPPLLSSVLLGLLVWAYGTGNFQVSVLVKMDAYSSVAAFTALRSILVVGCQYTLVRYEIPEGLLWGLVAGEMATRALVMLSPQVKLMADGFKGLADLSAVLSRYSHFTVSGTIQETLSSFNFLMPLFVVPAFYGSFTGGLFAVAHRLTWAPVQLANQAAGAIVTDQLSRFDTGALKAFFRRYLVVLAPTWIVSTLGLWVAIHWVITHLFSGEWLGAAEMVGWIAIWAGSFFVALPARFVVRVKRWQSMQLAVEVVMAASVVAAVLALSSAGDFIRLACAAGVLQNASLVALVAWKLRVDVAKIQAGETSK